MSLQASLFSFTVPLLGGLPKRKGLLIQLKDPLGKFSWGEISPLPGFSEETLEDALFQITNELTKIIQRDPLQALQGLLEDTTLYPSVSIGLFGALYGLIRKENNIQAPLQGLLYGSYAQIQEQIIKALSQGLSTIKLKTSQLSLTESKEIIDQLKGKCALRIDVNRSWNNTQANQFFSQFANDRFDYVEEPYKKNNNLNHFCHPVALDESLRELALCDIKQLSRLKAVVIKPMLMGVSPYVKDLLNTSTQYGWKISFSSSFETGVGLYQIALFGEYFGLLDRPVGLDTYKFFSPDILLDRHTICDGNILFRKPCPNYSMLSEVNYA